MVPREGHLKVDKRMLAYLKTFPKGRVIIDTSNPSDSENPVDDHPNGKDFYPDTPKKRCEMTFLCQRDQKSG
jgi:hypothetical protein